MKYCKHCGTEMKDDAMFCPNCGKSQEPTTTTASTTTTTEPAAPTAASGSNRGMIIAIEVFMILGCITPFYNIIKEADPLLPAWMNIVSALLPLAWCIPMTIVTFLRFKNNQPFGMGFKICTLIFVSLIAGILLLCLKDYPAPNYEQPQDTSGHDDIGRF